MLDGRNGAGGGMTDSGQSDYDSMGGGYDEPRRPAASGGGYDKALDDDIPF